MQELEKILEEIKKILEDNKVSELNSDGTIDKYVIDAKLAWDYIKDIIRKHMNDGWIPVEDRLQKRTLDEKMNKSYKKYLVFIDSVDSWDIDIAVYDFWNDKKWRTAHDGYEEIENVVAWRPLPEPYKSKRSEE